MFYGVSQSTDLHDKQTQIKKFTSKIAALKWAEINSGNFTYDDPEAARNYHHTYKHVYEFKGKISKKEIDYYYTYSTPTYPVTTNDAIASFLYYNGVEIK